MANISDTIESFIKSFFGEGESIKLSRNELAHYFGVSPSQINYVLATRFTVDRGYAIESRRGGGGCITVTRIAGEKDSLIPSLIKEIEAMEYLTYNKAAAFTERLCRDDILTDTEAAIIKCALSDRALASPVAENLRKNVFREILIGIVGR